VGLESGVGRVARDQFEPRPDRSVNASALRAPTLAVEPLNWRDVDPARGEPLAPVGQRPLGDGQPRGLGLWPTDPAVVGVRVREDGEHRARRFPRVPEVEVVLEQVLTVDRLLEQSEAECAVVEPDGLLGVADDTGDVGESRGVREHTRAMPFASVNSSVAGGGNPDPGWGGSPDQSYREPFATVAPFLANDTLGHGHRLTA